MADDYQGHGLGAALMRHLAAIARGAGLKEFIAEVLAENAPMLRVFERSGLPLNSGGTAPSSMSRCNYEGNR